MIGPDLEGDGRFRRGIYLLPSVFTTGNLFFGFYSLVASVRGDYRAAAIAIGIAMLLDGIDGRIARLTDSQTDFGTAFDSLADVITFALAPAFLAFSWGLWDLRRIGWLAAFFYVTCGAARLARFTVQTASSDRRYFAGLPTPPAAGLLAALAFYWPGRLESRGVGWMLLLLVLSLSFLMISKIRYRSFKNIDLRQRQPYTLVTVLALVFLLIALDPETVLLGMASIYVASGPAERLWSHVLRRHRKGQETSKIEPDPGS